MAMVSCKFGNRLKPTAEGAGWAVLATMSKILRKLGFYVKGKAGLPRLFSLTREDSHVTHFDFK
jgi:hypothetical protein